MVNPTVIAVDWSGAKRTGLKSGIWLAVMQRGRLVQTEAVSNRAQAISHVQDFASPVVAGFDFSFGFPAWFARKHRCTTIAEVWSMAEHEGEKWLASPPMPPFWRDRCEVPVEQRRRRCEEGLRPAKSIFQLVGNGQVGAGSVRGMPHLARLREAGFAIWPFDAPGDRTVVEIYPTALRRLAPAHLPERDFSTKDERDAVLSAAVMWEDRASFANLEAATDPTTLIEGDVWVPSSSL